MSRLFSLWQFALALWIGVELGGGFLAASAIFAALAPDTGLAGTLAGAIFARLNVIAAVSLPLFAAGAAAIGEGRRRWVAAGLLGVALVLVLAEMAFVSPEIRSLREQLGAEFGSVGAAPAGHPLRARFGMLHGISFSRAALQLLCAAGAWFALRPGQGR